VAFVAVFGMVPMAAWSGVPTPSSRSDLQLPQNDAEEVRSTAREVLARPEFRPPSRTLLERARDWLVDQVEGMVDAIVQGERAGALAWAVLVAGVVALLFLVLRFARGVTPDAVRGASSALDRRRPPEDWRAEAEANAAAGRWRDAVRCRYRALVAELGARGLVEEVPGRTSGEYRAEIAVNAPGVSPDFSEASELFETAWYGRTPTRGDDDRRIRALTDRVLSTRTAARETAGAGTGGASTAGAGTGGASTA
jgi:hypothetical protein